MSMRPTSKWWEAIPTASMVITMGLGARHSWRSPRRHTEVPKAPCSAKDRYRIRKPGAVVSVALSMPEPPPPEGRWSWLRVRMRTLAWVGVSLVTVVLPACTGSPCQSVDAGFVGALEIQGGSVGDAAATEPEPGIWLVAVDVDGQPAVWATDADPSAPLSGTAVIIGANEAARRVSVLGVDVGPTATHPVAVASRDQGAVAEAESCIEGG
jgi:hypothetical protein